MDEVGARSGTDRRICIVGGGASGSLLAARLLHRGTAGLEVVVVDPAPELGRGVAYGTDDPWHRLNVPAGGMSALPEDPDHFARWAGAGAVDFVTRSEYARYLADVLDAARLASAATLRHVRARADRLLPSADGVTVVLHDGHLVRAGAVVLATGIEAPVLPPFLAGLAGHPRVVANPWAPGALAGLGEAETVGIIGTGLTGVDVAGSVLRDHPGRHVVALSRHGLVPFRHEDPWRPRLPEPVFSVAEFAGWADPMATAAERIEAYGDDWRRAIDSLRPITAHLWLGLDAAHRAEFLETWRHAWDIRRHRIAAEVGRDLDRWATEGRLRVHAARIERVAPGDDGTSLRIESGDVPGGPGATTWTVDRIVVATGPDGDARANNLLASGIDAGFLQAGPMGIALDTEPWTGRVRGRHGASPHPIYALGPLRRGVLWESIAMPEVRVQAAELAAALTGAAGG